MEINTTTQRRDKTGSKPCELLPIYDGTFKVEPPHLFSNHHSIQWCCGTWGTEAFCQKYAEHYKPATEDDKALRSKG